MSIVRFTNCQLCDDGKLSPGDLFVDTSSGKIILRPADSSNVQTIDLKGSILAPGFIDIQNNGIYGLNFSALNSSSTASDIKQFAAFYKDCMAKYLTTGVTALCPTITSNFHDVYQKVLPIYVKTRSPDMADCLGAHIEGPFISAAKKGCHPVETLVDATSESFEHMYGHQNLEHNVSIITSAPEIPGVLDNIPKFHKEYPGIVLSIGHTEAKREQCVQALDEGATMITHFYNAMPQPHHRDVGVVGMVTDPATQGHRPYFGLICDGVHVAPAMCVMAYRASPETCVLTTDAMHLIGLPDGTYKWDKQKIVKTGAQLYLEGTKTLAGAATNLSVCVQNLVKWAEISLAEAVKTVTNNAAKLLKINHKGYLNPGCDADLVVLSQHGDVQQVFKLGKPVKTPNRLHAVL